MCLEAGLFSAVSSAFVIDVHSGLQPDPNEQSAALLRAILLTLNQSAIPNESPIVPPVQESPPSEIVTVTGLMYASLLISLLAAFVAMLGKQWLNRYLRHAGGSMIERCGDRQRKCDGLKKWPFHLFVESLPVMLQVALLLLACGLCKHMSSINTPVAIVLITLTVLGVIFYLGIIIVGASSYECPFQTPASSTFRGIWKAAKPHIISTLYPVFISVSSLRSLVSAALHQSWEIVQCWILHVVLWLPPITQWFHSRHRSLPIARPTPHRPASWLVPLYSLWEDVQCRILRAALHLPQIQPSPTFLYDPPTSPPLTPMALVTLHTANAGDVRCISWILWNITDPEALDAAIRFAGTVRWFEEGLNVEPPYDQIITTLEGCFDSVGKVYPGSRDRAYHSAQAALWIHVRALIVSEQFSNKFPLPTLDYNAATLDPDLQSLLELCAIQDTPNLFYKLCVIHRETTPTHLQWVSNVALHLSWAMQDTPDTFTMLSKYSVSPTKRIIPLNVLLNRLLTFCIFFDWSIEEEWLKIQDKTYVILSLCTPTHLTHSASDRFDQILPQFSQAITQAFYTSHSSCSQVQYLLNHIRNSGIRTKQLTEMVYELCSLVCEGHSALEYRKSTILLCLEIGFRHLNQTEEWIEAELFHTEHHQKLAEIVIGEKDAEAIADLIYAWSSRSNSHEPYPSLQIYTGYLTGLGNLYQSSPRLRKCAIYVVQLIVDQPLEQLEIVEFVGLLNDVQIHRGGIHNPFHWLRTLLHIIQCSAEPQCLSHSYWELLLEYAANWPDDPIPESYNPDVMVTLEGSKEWDKLKCWIGVVWIKWLPGGGVTTEEELGQVMLSLSQQKPEAIQELGKQMEQFSKIPWVKIPESFHWICEQTYNNIAQQSAL